MAIDLPANYLFDDMHPNMPFNNGCGQLLLYAQVMLYMCLRRLLNM